MNKLADPVELLMLEELAQEEVEFWESYILRYLNDQDEDVPPRAIRALALAEEKLASCRVLLCREDVKPVFH